MDGTSRDLLPTATQSETVQAGHRVDAPKHQREQMCSAGE